MPTRDLIAIDVALLLPEAVTERAKVVNAALLDKRPAGFRFDDTHLPHITLAQQFIRRVNLPALIERVDPILRGAPPLLLRVIGVGSSGTATHFAIQPTPDLQMLHEELLDAALPLEEADGGAEAFYSDGELAREGDVAWVSQFRSHSSYTRFSPHITLGIGPPPEFREAFEFTADRVALCQLGRFCACRIILLEWRLGSKGA